MLTVTCDPNHKHANKKPKHKT